MQYVIIFIAALSSGTPPLIALIGTCAYFAFAETFLKQS